MWKILFIFGYTIVIFTMGSLIKQNFASYGAQRDDEHTRATKRFNSMLNGTANKRMEKAFALLAA